MFSSPWTAYGLEHHGEEEIGLTHFPLMNALGSTVVYHARDPGAVS